MERGIVIVPAEDYMEMVRKVDILTKEAHENKAKAEVLDKIADEFYRGVLGFHKQNVMASAYYDKFEEDFDKLYEGFSDRMIEKACRIEKLLSKEGEEE